MQKPEFDMVNEKIITLIMIMSSLSVDFLSTSVLNFNILSLSTQRIIEYAT